MPRSGEQGRDAFMGLLCSLGCGEALFVEGCGFWCVRFCNRLHIDSNNTHYHFILILMPVGFAPLNICGFSLLVGARNHTLFEKSLGVLPETWDVAFLLVWISGVLVVIMIIK
jgi:hypothetical protein